MKTLNDTFTNKQIITNIEKDAHINNKDLLCNNIEISSYTDLINIIASKLKNAFFEENLLTVLSWLIMICCWIVGIISFSKEEYILSVSLMLGSTINYLILRVLCNISENISSINRKLK